MFFKNAARTAAVLFFSLNAFAQVGINTVSPNAQLDISSSNQSTPSNKDGILIPRVDAFPLAIPTASQNGMMIFLTTTVGQKLPGFYYWDNTALAWIGVGSKNNWGLNGNAGTNPGLNFIGTLDDNDVTFKRNNIRAGKIETSNTSFGVNAFSPLNIGVSNTAIGSNTLGVNTSGNYNTALGSGVLSANNTGFQNTGMGVNALFSNTVGAYNTASGTNALKFNTTGSFNTATGTTALFNNTTGYQNTATGTDSMYSNTTGINNVSNGDYSLRLNIDGNYNTAVGVSAMISNTNGNENTGIGMSSLYGNTTGNFNTGVGMFALSSNLSGINNTAVGAYALANGLLSGINNTALGGGTLNNTTGSDNTGLGYHAGINITTGSNNVAIGSNSSVQVATASDQLSIDNVIYGIRMSAIASAKIGIGEPLPNAKLQINSSSQSAPANTDGIIIPKVDTFPSTNPTAVQNGMMLFLTAANGSNQSGFYYWDDPSLTWISVGAKSNWNLKGNSATNPATNFIGTADNNAVAFRANNTEAMRITTTGAVGINTPAPDAKLQITSSNQASPNNTDGVLIPKVDIFPIANPTVAQNGMMVFLTTTVGSYQSGFYYWDNPSVSWLAIGAKNNWSLNGNAGTNAAINYIGSSDSKDVAFRSNNSEVLRITTSGKVGIGAPAPTAELEVNGFTKSGSNAPAVKMLKLTGTTGSVQGATTQIAHGLNSSKILSVSVLLDYLAGSSIPPSYNGSANYEYDYYITSTNVVVWIKSGNSANILSKPFRVLITYEQ